MARHWGATGIMYWEGHGDLVNRLMKLVTGLIALRVHVPNN